MLNLDLLASQYLFHLGRVLPHWLPVGLASVLIWLLFAYGLYFAARLAPGREQIIFLGRVAVAGIISLGIAAVIGYFYFRVRPFAALGFDALIAKSALEKSFPSDHAVVAWALGTILFLYNKKSGYWAGAAALLICLGRVLAGVHYVSDVLVGAGIGALAALLVFKISANAAGWTRGGQRGATGQ